MGCCTSAPDRGRHTDSLTRTPKHVATTTSYMHGPVRQAEYTYDPTTGRMVPASSNGNTPIPSPSGGTPMGSSVLKPSRLDMSAIGRRSTTAAPEPDDDDDDTRHAQDRERQQRAFVLQGRTPEEQRARLLELEEVARQDVTAVYLTAYKLLSITRQRLTLAVERGDALTASLRPAAAPTKPPPPTETRMIITSTDIAAEYSDAEEADDAADGTAAAQQHVGSSSSPLRPKQTRRRTSSTSSSAAAAAPTIPMAYPLSPSVVVSPVASSARRDSGAPPPLSTAPTLGVVPSAGDMAAGAEGAAVVLDPHDAPRRLLLSGISARGIDALHHKTQCATAPVMWSILKDDKVRALEQFNKGDGFFNFACKSGGKVTEDELRFIRAFINVTGTADEEAENLVPIIDCSAAACLSPYVCVLVKAMYLLPGARVSDFTQELIASNEYNIACQPGKPKMWDDVVEPRTFRETKTIIRFVYSIVIQMQVTEITDERQLAMLSNIDGIRPQKAIILERTKRNKLQHDSTVKCKSLLLYYEVDGGVLVTHCTVVLNTHIPTVVAAVVNNFGSSGSVEAAETSNMTRRFLVTKFGDSRSAAAAAPAATTVRRG